MTERRVKYRQVYETLKGSILGGKYPADRPMPSLRSLVRKHGFSTITIRRALDELERQGLIARHRGSGTFVSRSGVARKLGLIVPGVAYSEFFPPIVSEISRLAQENEYTLLFGDIASKRPEKRASMAKKLAREFAEQGVAGVLYQPLELVEDVKKVNREILSVFDRAQIPVVILDNDFVQIPERSEYDVVGIDNVAAGVLAAEHLLTLGVRNIHFLRRPRCSSSVNNRMRGVMSALNLKGLPMRMSVVLTAEPDDVSAVKRHLRRGRPDAFVCGNDAAAISLKQTLEGLGYRIPDDIMLIGFDDVAYANIVSPRLTTVRQPCKEIAGAAFRRLLARIADPTLPVFSIFLPVRLIVRESTKVIGKNKGGRNSRVQRKGGR